jgi:hypothetical protein
MNRFQKLRFLEYTSRAASGRTGGEASMAGEQGYGDVPISRKYCLVVSWAFAKHV